jgi:hypothetical protein
MLAEQQTGSMWVKMSELRSRNMFHDQSIDLEIIGVPKSFTPKKGDGERKASAVHFVEESRN